MMNGVLLRRQISSLKKELRIRTQVDVSKRSPTKVVISGLSLSEQGTCQHCKQYSHRAKSLLFLKLNSLLQVIWQLLIKRRQGSIIYMEAHFMCNQVNV